MTTHRFTATGPRVEAHAHTVGKVHVEAWGDGTPGRARARLAGHRRRGVGGAAAARRRGLSPAGARPSRLRAKPGRRRRGLPGRRRRHRRADGRRRPSRRSFLRRPGRHVRRGPPSRSDQVTDAARARRLRLGPGSPTARSLVDAVRARLGPGPSRRGVGRPLPEGGRERSRRVPARVPRRRRPARAGPPPWAAALVPRTAPGRAGGRTVPEAGRLRRPQRRLRRHLRRRGRTDRRLPRHDRGCRPRDPVHRQAPQRRAARPVAHRHVLGEPA